MRKRKFTARQRIALFIKAQGLCLECNELLAPSFHADHVLPFSKGGATEMQNGQALCPTCNLKKSDKIQATSKNTDFLFR
jgi:5-methylcytosine-specific restriction endonuclease McrA